MVFSEPSFLFTFLPLVLGCYYVVPNRCRNLVLLGASLSFYAYDEGFFVLIMLCSIGMNYLIALHIQRSAWHRFPLAVGVGLNIAGLITFKYANFISDNLNSVLPWLGLSPIPLNPIHLPIGISFFTFQAISYLVDVHRGDAQVQHKPVALGLYISLFPQLIAGPIIRYGQIADQITGRRESLSKFAIGARRFIIGLAKKMMIANVLAQQVDTIFSYPGHEITTTLAWFAVICYAIQIYFDFSGYSDMAIGLGYMLGFRFPENFQYPYISQSITEFWRRWHISLSSWFRDYVYIPLGGNRRSPFRTYLNLLAIFVLCGFWHGASWNFLIWGLLHGVFLIFERASQDWRKRIPSLISHLYCCFIVLVIWVPFRADNLNQTLTFWSAMFGLNEGALPFVRPLRHYLDFEVMLAFVGGIVGATPIVPFLSAKISKANQDAFSTKIIWFAITFALLCLLVYCTMLMAAGAYRPFIYFRF